MNSKSLDFITFHTGPKRASCACCDTSHTCQMEPLILIKQNWFTRKPNTQAVNLTLLLALLLFGAGFSYLSDWFAATNWMAATPDLVFQQHQYWRAWTTLFAHGDLAHLFNNALLFVPLSCLLIAYFDLWFFPFFGFLMGGLINLIVLKTMPAQTALIGISGLVYWMGAAWFTLFILIDRRKNFKYKFANVLFLTLMLFVPETYKPQISYLSHFIGFMFGIAAAGALFLINRRKYDKAEVKEYIYDEDVDFPVENTGF